MLRVFGGEELIDRQQVFITAPYDGTAKGKSKKGGWLIYIDFIEKYREKLCGNSVALLQRGKMSQEKLMGIVV